MGGGAGRQEPGGEGAEGDFFQSMNSLSATHGRMVLAVKWPGV